MKGLNASGMSSQRSYKHLSDICVYFSRLLRLSGRSSLSGKWLISWFTNGRYDRMELLDWCFRHSPQENPDSFTAAIHEIYRFHCGCACNVGLNAPSCVLDAGCPGICGWSASSGVSARKVCVIRKLVHLQLLSPFFPPIIPYPCIHLSVQLYW